MNNYKYYKIDSSLPLFTDGYVEIDKVGQDRKILMDELGASYTMTPMKKSIRYRSYIGAFGFTEKPSNDVLSYMTIDETFKEMVDRKTNTKIKYKCFPNLSTDKGKNLQKRLDVLNERCDEAGKYLEKYDQNLVTTFFGKNSQILRKYRCPDFVYVKVDLNYVVDKLPPELIEVTEEEYNKPCS